MQARIKNLHAVRKFRKERSRSQSALNTMSLDDIRRREMQLFPPPGCASRIRTLSDGELTEQAGHAKDWLLGILDCHDEILGREHEIRMFSSAVSREMTGHEDSWSDMDRMYMMLTDDTLTSPETRLQSAFVLVLHLNYAERLKDVVTLAAVRLGRIQYARQLDGDVHRTRERIGEDFDSLMVDHFACAIPLSSLAQSAAASIVDNNAGCCPICQNSYTDLSAFEIEELLADYPVRLKHCGHIVGRGCLEQWMVTPKIDEAKYPHRTCPLCRMEMEGVEAPPVPPMLKRHLKTDFRAIDTTKELLHGYDIDPEECPEAIVACLSRGIACDELLVEVHRQRRAGDIASSEGREEVLRKRREQVKQEMRAWGFRGDAAWRDIRVEWMDSGVTRKE